MTGALDKLSIQKVIVGAEMSPLDEDDEGSGPAEDSP